MKKRIKKLLVLGIFTTGAIHALNLFENYTADLKNMLKNDQGDYYEWKHGDLFYSVHGSGSPLLLIHDLNPLSSGYEWSKMVKRLEKDHKVYVLDLLGCGRSDKPMLTYTTYLYVEMLHDFIKDIIGEKTIVAATGASSFFTVIANNVYENDIEKLILINPEKLSEAKKVPDDKSKFIKTLIELPVLGTFIYNIETGEKNITRLFREMYFSKPALVNERITSAYYEASHKGNGTGRFLLSSLRGHYMNCTMPSSLRKCSNLYIIGSRDRAHSVNIIDEYANYNSHTETAYVSGSKYLPQLEVPAKLHEIMNLFL